MEAIIKPAAVLLAICLVIGASLAFTYAATKDRIAEGEAEEANRARSDVLPGAAFTPYYVMDESEVIKISEYPVVIEIYNAFGENDGELKGYVATVVTRGYGGEVYVIVGVTGDGLISGVRVARHSETPGLGANTAKPEYYGQFTGKDASAELAVVKNGAAGDIGAGIVAVSGATVSSDAVTRAVNAAAGAITELR